MLPLFVASFFLNSWATDAMEAAGLQTFGVPTTVDSVEISPLSARWSLANLRVASPPGFGEFPYLIIDNGIFDLSFRSMFFNPLYLEELTLRDVRLNWDQRVDGTSNGKTIMDGLSASRIYSSPCARLHLLNLSDVIVRFNDYLMTKQVIVDKITFFNIVTRLCLHPSCEMSPPPYFVIKKVEALRGPRPVEVCGRAACAR
eukprot:g19723.t1